MADTRRSPPAESLAGAALPAAVAGLLAHTLPSGGRIGVALSGGRDSVALLDAAVDVAANARCEVIALHVHHGLSANAGAWAAFCRDACSAKAIPFAMREVQIMRAARVSVEAAARAARYEALDALAREHGACAVLLAHHADDQAETTLLQLLRGAGPHGLAAMPSARLAKGIWWLRPFLALRRTSVDAYVAHRGLRYINDESNADLRYRRNALRETIVPGLRAMSPGYPGALVRAAAHQAEAAALLDEFAELDARSAWDGATLDCATLRAHSAARGRNLLRWFLRQRGLRAPSSARIAEMLRQLTSAGNDTRVAIAHGGVAIGVHRGRIVIHRAPPARYAQEWSGALAVELAHGTLNFTATRGAGIAARHLASSRVTIRMGMHGERLRLAGRDSHRSVADLLREAGVATWDRIGLPRVYCGEALAGVPFAGVDARFAATHDEPAFALDWQPRPA